MTDITELAQRNELLIANGQQTADLLRHLADNEIDSDYFAVVSECESYGKETDAELSITEFALRAAGYVDALVVALESEKRICATWRKTAESTSEKLEKAQAKADVYDMLRDDYGLREKGVGLADFVDWQANRIAELESRTVKLTKLKMLEDYLAEVAIEERKQILVGVKLEFHRACVAAGIKMEAE